MGKSLLITVITVSLFFLPGCGKKGCIKPKDLYKLKIGMNKPEVIDQIGQPSVYRGSMINAYDQTIDVFEYIVDMGMSHAISCYYGMLCLCSLGLYAPFYIFMPHELDSYWMFFFNDKLVKWCKAGDWNNTQHTIHEIKFKNE